MKKLMRHPQRFKGLSVGLDPHKTFIQFSVLDRKGDELANERIAAKKKAVRTFLARWGKKGKLQVALEASGRFLWLFDLLAEELGRERVRVAAPSKVRVIAESGEKTDASDAWWLAYLMYEGRLPEAFVAEGDLRELRIAVRELRWVVDERADLLRRFRSHVAQLGESLRKGAFDTLGGREEIEALLARTEGMRGLALERLWARIQELREERGRWQGEVERLAKSFPQIGVLEEALPGVGPVVAPIVWAELGDPRRFRKAKAYAKATGLTPSHRESGGRRSPGKITRAGSRHVRWALTRAIVSCMRCTRGDGLSIKHWVTSRYRRQAKKKVIVAGARKLAEGIWRLFAWGEVFDLTRMFGRPPARPARTC